MGNQLSHYYIMKDIIKNKYPFSVVFQDDAILRESFNLYLNDILDNLPKKSEMVNIGFHKYACFEKFISWDLKSENDHTVLAKKD